MLWKSWICPCALWELTLRWSSCNCRSAFCSCWGVRSTLTWSRPWPTVLLGSQESWNKKELRRCWIWLKDMIRFIRWNMLCYSTIYVIFKFGRVSTTWCQLSHWRCLTFATVAWAQLLRPLWPMCCCQKWRDHGGPWGCYIWIAPCISSLKALEKRCPIICLFRAGDCQFWR